ncbi:MAG TPA: hypothetical protein PLL69_02835, partial [Gemmatimonadales bacterium]|nr:hypothetical protein [Gemmatimonadales bacterium]
SVTQPAGTASAGPPPSAFTAVNGSPFTATFVIGSWDGEFTFLEPMVDLAYLRTKPDLREQVPVPSSFGTAADRPTGYRVTWNSEAKEYRIGLTDLGG